MGIKEIYLNIIKATYDKYTANSIVNDEKLKMFTLRSGPRMPILASLIENSIGSFSHRS